jgi:putative Mn2+ efflux pump MntP
VLALLVVAVSLGLTNLAAAIGIGVGGVDARTRLQVGLAFGLFEAGMPVIGVALGQGVAAQLGASARWIGGGLLLAVGAYGLVRARRGGEPGRRGGEPGRRGGEPVRRGAGTLAWLLVTALALSLDNLLAGFALGTVSRGILIAALVIGGVSMVMSLAGLELGARIGRIAGRACESASALMLMLLGAAIAAGLA